MASVYEKSQIEALPYVKNIRLRGENVLNDKGEVVIDGKVCVGLKSYAKHTGLPSKLGDIVRDTELKPVGRARSGTNTVDVYEKAVIEGLEYVKKHRSNAEVTEIGENGEVMIGETAGIACSTKYTELHGFEFGTFKKAIAEEGLQPIGKVKSGSFLVDVYEKTAIERLPYVLQSLVQPNGGGEYVLPDGTIVLELKEYGKSADGIGLAILRSAVAEAGLIPVGQIPRGQHLMDLYKRTEIENLPYMLSKKRVINENAEVQIDGILCIAPMQYAELHNLDYSSLRKDIRAAKVAPRGKACSVNKILVDVFEKAMIENLPYVKQKGVIAH